MPQAGDHGVVSDDGALQVDIFDVGEIADDGIPDDGPFDAGVVADGDVGADDGILDVAVPADAHRVDDNGIVVGRQVGAGVAVAVEEGGIGVEQHLFFAAVEPVVHCDGSEFHPFIDHVHESVGQGELPVGADVVADVEVEGLDQPLHVPDLVKTYHGQVGFRDAGFFHDPLDEFRPRPVFHHAVLPRVAHLLDAEAGMRAVQDFFEVDVDDGVAKEDKKLVRSLEVFPRRPDGMARTEADILADVFPADVRVFGVDVVFDLFAEITDDEDEFPDAQFDELIQDEGDDRLAGHRNERLRLRVGQRAESGARAGDGDDGFHNIVELNVLKKSVAGSFGSACSVP